MTKLPEINTQFLLDFLTKLLNTPSPTGFAEPAIAFTEQTLTKHPGCHSRPGHAREPYWQRWKGNRIMARLPLTAHADTLGGMVKEIKSNGRLKLTRIGGYAWNTIEGEGCTVFTRGGRQVRGSILLTKASSHVFGGETGEMKRDEDSLEVRLDARTGSELETLDLGIGVGDFVTLDPRVEINAGFVRSRHLDDKAGVAALVTAIKALADGGMRPRTKTHFLVSNYEEVGHGAAAGIRRTWSSCWWWTWQRWARGRTRTSSMPRCASRTAVDHTTTGCPPVCASWRINMPSPTRWIFIPFYGSDGEAWWRAGGNAPVALIGPGVDASHNYERTHTEALVATTKWVLAYLLEE